MAGFSIIRFMQHPSRNNLKSEFTSSQIVAQLELTYVSDASSAKVLTVSNNFLFSESLMKIKNRVVERTDP